MNTRLNLKIAAEIFLLSLTLFAAIYVVFTGRHQWLTLLAPLLFIQWVYLFRRQRRAYVELHDFVESIRYRDFSRRLSVKKAPFEVKRMRMGFNEITESIRNISKEKEMQYQYLQKIMEMVNTGILSYDAETREVHWINESLRQLLQLPYLKNVHNLEKRIKELYDDLMSLKPGESKVSTFHVEAVPYKVFLSATAFQTEDKKFNLVGFQNISSAVDEAESEAWRKLLRVLTHEIMNSVAPISSLANTLESRLKEHEEQGYEEAFFQDMVTGIGTIKNRSESLLKFAETYRSLNKISAPDIKAFFVCDLFENIYNLMEPTLFQKNIELEILLKEPGLQLKGDISLIEQALINLVLNAMEAVKERDDRGITLSGERVNDKVQVRVADNGVGMTPEILDKIFIPFFTTRKNGSGIGLSLCRQVMRAHGGSLLVVSEENKGTVFTLQFPGD